MKSVDFFCGAEGITKGLLNAGIDAIYGINNDSKVKDTYIDVSDKTQSLHSVSKRIHFDPPGIYLKR